MKRLLLPCLVGSFLVCSTSTVLHIPLQMSGPAVAQAQGLNPPLPAPPDPVIQLSERFEAIAARVLPAVVAVEAVKPPKTAGGKTKPVEESGSGVLIKADGKPGVF